MHLLAWAFLPGHWEETCAPLRGQGQVTGTFLAQPSDRRDKSLFLHSVFLGQDGLNVSIEHGMYAMVGQ